MSIREDASHIARSVLSDAGQPAWGQDFQIATSHIAEILALGSLSLQNYGKWRGCVAQAAKIMVRSRQIIHGAQLQKLAEDCFLQS